MSLPKRSYTKTEIDKITVLKYEISKAATSPSFKHHNWFKEYHLDIVDQIVGELLPHYPAADKYTTEALAWLHDYEKIINFDSQYNTKLVATRTLLTKLKVAKATEEKLLRYINRLNAKTNIAKAPLEVQIVSSADGAAHMIGPFYALYWYENPHISVKDILAENNRKIAVDWNKKIVLPEVREAFEARRQYLLEMFGAFPDKFLL